MIELKKGVRLHVIATKKYKTIQIYGRFTTRLTKEIMTKRALLANLLETNSLRYPDQTKLSGGLPWDTAFSAGMIPFILPGAIKAVAAGYLGVLLGRRLPFTKLVYR